MVVQCVYDISAKETCPDCGSRYPFIDEKAAEVICKECGRVLMDSLPVDSYEDTDRCSKPPEFDSDNEKKWHRLLDDLIDNEKHGIPTAIRFHVHEMIRIVYTVHKFYSRESSCVAAALLWHSALCLNMRKYDFKQYALICGVTEESWRAGRCRRAFELIRVLHELYVEAHTLSIAWTGDVASLTGLLCTVEARCTREQLEHALCCALQMPPASEEDGGDERHSPLVRATLCLAQGMGMKMSEAAPIAGISRNAYE